MPAQALLLSFNVLILTILFPATVFNYLILNTPFIPSVKTFIISSKSMNPELDTGSLIYTVKQKSYQVGDIVTFKDSIGRVTHRIIGIKELSGIIYYQTKGDANKVMDQELIASESIYGKVVLSLPFISI